MTAGVRGDAGSGRPSDLSAVGAARGRSDGASDPRFDDLIAVLRRAKQRASLLQFAENLATAIALGLAVFCLLALVHRVMPGLAPIVGFEWLTLPAWLADIGAPPLPQHVLVAVIAGIAALIASEYLLYRRRTVGIDRMAVAADRRYGTAERLSTALALARKSDRNGVVGEALLNDALKRAGTVDESSLVPFRVPRPAIAIPVLTVAAILLALWPQPEPRAQSTADLPRTSAAAQAADLERLEVAANLQAVAAVLAQDGETRNDPVLQGIANELNELGLLVAANSDINAGDLANELERLRDLTAGAYERAGVGDRDPANQTRLVEGALEEFRQTEFGENTGDTAVAPEGPQAPQLPTDEDGNAPEVATIDAGEDGGAQAPLGGMDVAADDIDPADGAPAANANPIRGNQTTDYDNPYDEVEPTTRAMPDEAELIGVGEGYEGDVAGLGGADLWGEAGAITPIGVDGEFVLEDEDPANGRMIRLNLPPIAELMGVDAGELAEGDGWRQLAEQEVQRTIIPAQARDAVGRYFQTLTPGTAE